MATEFRHLTPVQETLFLTLYGRALDNRRPRPILGDRAAGEIVDKVDYDFAKLKILSSTVAQVALRAKMLDEVVRRFVTTHPDAVVLDLGAGLDTRILRVLPPPTIDWYDIDFPEIIALRTSLLPEHGQAHAVGASLTDPDCLEGIPADRPTVIVADGLLAFLGEDEIISLLTRLTDHFHSGDLAFNDYGRLRFGAWLAKFYGPLRRIMDLRTYAGFNDPHQPERWNPRLRLIEEASLARSPDVALFPPVLRVMTRMAARSTTMSRTARILHYRF